MSLKKTSLIVTAIVIIGLLIVGGIYYNNRQKSINNPNDQQTISETCIDEDCLVDQNLEYPAGELPQEVIDSLNLAINDEYKAHATYQAVIDKFGPERPFIMIIRAEEKHIASLKALYDKYGLDIPTDAYSGLEVKPTLADNCSIGVQAEVDNAALYREKLIPAAKNYPDIINVYTNLMNASQNKHLPAFQRCAS